jgi:hypothetical protein
MAWFQKTASSLDDVAGHIARQSQEAKNQDVASENETIGVAESAPSSGITIAPGVRFSERLWARLGAQGREKEKQIRREKLTDATAFPEIPPSLFDSTFRRDAIWKQRCFSLAYPSIEIHPDIDQENLISSC